MKRFIQILLLFVPLLAHATDNYCLVTPVDLSATGRTEITRSSGLDFHMFNAATATARTTGSPSGISVVLEAGNYVASTQTPVTATTAVTSGSGGLMGTLHGPFKKYFVNLTTLTAGTAPHVIVDVCWTATAP